MANSSIEWWDIDGVSLHQYGWAVKTVGGSRYDLPPRRGDNIVLAYRPGSIWRPKLPQERPITLPMFLTGMDPATGGQSGDEMLRWNDSWDFLRRLVWRLENRQFTLTRRTLLTIEGTPQLLVASALAENNGTMAPAMTGRTRADFEIDLNLPDPYFYGAPRTVTVPVATPTTVLNPGHDLAAYSNMTVQFVGPLTNPRLTNTTPEPDLWVQYTGTVAAGQTLTLDIGAFTAVFSGTGVGDVSVGGVAGTPRNAIAKISHGGARHWMGLLPAPFASNQLTLTGSGAGSAVLTYQPPYL